MRCQFHVACRRIPIIEQTMWGPGWSWCSSKRKSFPPRTNFLCHPPCSFVTASTELSDQKHNRHRYPKRIDCHAVIFLCRHFRSGSYNIMAARVSSVCLLRKRQKQGLRQPSRQQWSKPPDKYGWHAMGLMRGKYMDGLIGLIHWANTLQIYNMESVVDWNP